MLPLTTGHRILFRAPQFNLDHKLACYCSIQISHPVGILCSGQEKLVVTPISWLAWDSLTWRPCSPNLTCEESFVEVGKESEILTSEPLPIGDAKMARTAENVEFSRISWASVTTSDHGSEFHPPHFCFRRVKCDGSWSINCYLRSQPNLRWRIALCVKNPVKN